MMKATQIKFSVTKKVALLLTGLTCIIILFLSVSFFLHFRITIKESLTSALDSVVNSNADNMDRLFLRLELMMDIVESEDSNFAHYLMQFDDEMIGDIQRYQQFENELKKNLDISLTPAMSYYGATFFVDDAMPMSQVFPNAYAGIFTNQNYYYTPPVLSSAKDAQHAEWYQTTLEKQGDLHWFKVPENPNMLYMSKALHAFLESEGSYKRLGVFLIALDATQLTQSFDMSKLTYGTIIVLSDESNTAIYSTDSSLEGQTITSLSSDMAGEGIMEGIKEVFAGSQRTLEYRKGMQGGLQLTAFVPVNDINAMVNEQFSILTWLTVIMMLAVIALVIYVSRIIVRPIVKLSRHMKINEKKKTLDTISSTGVGADEIGVIYQNYNTHVEQMRQLIGQIYEKAEQEKEARLKMLQAQINPHFIYNTLDSICCVSLMRQQEDIAEMLSRLANLMRYNINEPDAMIPIKKELEQIEDYVQIQKFRVDGKIEMFTNADSTIENLLIPKMIIQPLVENSFFHGSVNLKEDILKVDILFYADHDVLIIKVRDNGYCEDVDQINKHLKGQINISKGNGGLGIRNVEQRIQMKFGSNYRLSYEKEGKKGVVAIITIPKIVK